MKLPAFLSEERDPYLLGLLRVGIASLLLLLTLRLAREYLGGRYFGDVFHLPLLPEALVPSRRGYGLLLACQALTAVLALLGLVARPALLIAALCGLYGMACDRLQYHNNRYTLLLVALLVALTPCDRSFVWAFGAKAPPHAPSPPPGDEKGHAKAPRWAAYLVGVQLSLVYLSSSLGKLLDGDWRGGTVMLLRFTPFRATAEQWVPAGMAEWLTEPWFGQLAAVSALATELLLALGPWLARPRILALWVGVMFHAGIELFANVELFSYTMLCAYLVFVTPERRERRLSWSARDGAAGLLAKLAAGLDFLARFRHERVPGQQALLVVHDRGGQPHQGLAALRELTRATPLLFPLWLPLSLLTWRKR
ncbi:MAG TPA: HTTM domain-containing protein [Polyangiaceae bacterium]|nr:HTTM domain-containing protein [Polyangiaceae bacterium]